MLLVRSQIPSNYEVYLLLFCSLERGVIISFAVTLKSKCSLLSFIDVEEQLMMHMFKNYTYYSSQIWHKGTGVHI